MAEKNKGHKNKRIRKMNVWVIDLCAVFAAFLIFGAIVASAL